MRIPAAELAVRHAAVPHNRLRVADPNDTRFGSVIRHRQIRKKRVVVGKLDILAGGRSHQHVVAVARRAANGHPLRDHQVRRQRVRRLTRRKDDLIALRRCGNCVCDRRIVRRNIQRVSAEKRGRGNRRNRHHEQLFHSFTTFEVIICNNCTNSPRKCQG